MSAKERETRYEIGIPKCLENKKKMNEKKKENPHGIVKDGISLQRERERKDKKGRKGRGIINRPWGSWGS